MHKLYLNETEKQPFLVWQEVVAKEVATRGPLRRGRAATPQQRGFHGAGRVPPIENMFVPLSLASVGTTIW